MSNAVNIPCLDNAAKHFRIDTYKPDRGPAVATATEVELTDSGFTYVPFQDRHVRIPFEGRNTDKNRAVAMSKLMAQLKANKWIAEDASL